MKVLFLFCPPFFLFFLQAHAQRGFFVKSVDNTAIYVEEAGQGDPVVLLAGGPGMEPDYLRPLVQRLAATHRCLLLHQRGTGRTQVEANPKTITIAQYIADIEALRQHIKAKQLTVLGHSWGGMLGQLYAGQHPGHVKRLLLLLDSGGPSLAFTVFYNDNILMRLRETDLQALQDAERNGDFARIIHLITPGYFYDRSRGLAFQKVAAPLNKNAGRINELLLTEYGQLGDQVATQLAQYKGPVCLIQGRQDPIGESTAYEIRGILPQTESHFIERSGHFPWLEGEKAAETFFERLNQCVAR